MKRLEISFRESLKLDRSKNIPPKIIVSIRYTGSTPFIRVLFLIIRLIINANAEEIIIYTVICNKNRVPVSSG